MADRPKRQPLPVVAYDAPTDDGGAALAYAAWFHKYGHPLPDGAIPLADHVQAQACIDILENLLDQSEAVRRAQAATIEVLTKQLEAHQAGQSTPEHAAVGRGGEA